MPDVHAALYEYPQFPVFIRMTLNTETPEVTRFLGTKGVIEILDGQLTLSTQRGMDTQPGWYYRSFPKAMREQYERDWHAKNDSILAQEVTETTKYRPPDGYSETREHLRCFFDAVRTRKPVIEDATFGNHTAIACHMANHAYFKKTIALWDASTRSIRG